MQMAAIYARVSSEQQREAHTVASQTAALIELAKTLEFDVPKAWIIEDEGYREPRSNGQAWSACATWRPKDRSRPSSSTARIA